MLENKNPVALGNYRKLFNKHFKNPQIVLPKSKYIFTKL